MSTNTQQPDAQPIDAGPVAAPSSAAPTAPSRTASPNLASAAPHAVEPWRVFAERAVAFLGAELKESEDGLRVVPLEDSFSGEDGQQAGSRWFPLFGPRREVVKPVEPIEFTTTSPAELIDRLIGLLADQTERPVLAPADQPKTSHEIADRLLNAYQVDDGKIHLAGCHLEATPLVCWSLRGEHDGEPVVRHHFTTASGVALEPSLIEALALGGPMVQATGTCRQPSINSAPADQGNAAGSDYLPTAVVEAKRCVGTLQATIAGGQLAIPFDGWARTLQPPPAVCPESGAESFHLTLIEDDRVVALESTGVCEESGRRMLGSDLRTCSVSGRLLDAGLCILCPVMGEPVEKKELVTCVKCGQQVSPHAITPGGCRGCTTTQPLPTDSPLREEILAAAPILKKWRRPRTAETASVRIVEASTLWRRLVAVFDLETGEPVHAATRPRFGGSWKTLPLAELS